MEQAPVKSKTIHGAPVFAHYLGVFNAKQEIIGDALKLLPPARIELQIVGNQRGFQLHMPYEVVIPLSRPDIVGFSFFNHERKFLVAFSIAGNPEGRNGTESYVINSRYIIMAVKKRLS